MTRSAARARVRDAAESQLVTGRDHDRSYRLDDGARPAKLAARLSDPRSGRVLELFSDQPGLQLYAGNFIDGTTVGQRGRIYQQSDGIALEPQRLPDSPNRPEFGGAELRPGQTYTNTMVFRLTTKAPKLTRAGGR